VGLGSNQNNMFRSHIYTPHLSTPLGLVTTLHKTNKSNTCAATFLANVVQNLLYLVTEIPIRTAASTLGYNYMTSFHAIFLPYVLKYNKSSIKFEYPAHTAEWSCWLYCEEYIEFNKFYCIENRDKKLKPFFFLPVQQTKHI
jgi:hypothetical protein